MGTLDIGLFIGFLEHSNIIIFIILLPFHNRLPLIPQYYTPIYMLCISDCTNCWLLYIICICIIIDIIHIIIFVILGCLIIFPITFHKTFIPFFVYLLVCILCVLISTIFVYFCISIFNICCLWVDFLFFLSGL